MRLLEKLRRFAVEELDAEERLLFAQLVAPAVQRATADDDVEGFGGRWEPTLLADALVEAVRERGIRVVGLSD